ncbi:MAG: hypothetical protein Aurels2KO_54120 [Aureliella sp.]
MSDTNRLGYYGEFAKDHWTQDERDNFAVVAGFLTVLRAMDFDRLLSEYGDHPYVQHNVTMHDGVKGVAKAGQKATKWFPEFAIDTKRIFVDGNFVVVHSHMIAKTAHRDNDRRGQNVLDVWQVTDGKIVEHWDSIQPLDFLGRLFNLLTGGIVKNDNGVF